MKLRFSATAALERDRRVSEGMSRMLAYGAADGSMTPEVAEARKNRSVNRRTAAYGAGGAGGAGGGFGDIQFATGRPRDPLFYWRQNNLPYDFSQNEELAKVRAFCRLLYQTDPIIGSCVDIFSKFPAVGDAPGMQGLAAGPTSTTTCSSARSTSTTRSSSSTSAASTGPPARPGRFATFNEDLGIWDDEELLNPDDVKVERSPFLKEPRFFIRLPWTIRQILQTRQPAWEYNRLIQEYPELTAYTAENALHAGVQHPAASSSSSRVTRSTCAACRCSPGRCAPMLQQEMLNTALDSIADRLYTPLILVQARRVSATDLGTSRSVDSRPRTTWRTSSWPWTPPWPATSAR